jgi:SulP family sulfate permease
MEETVEKKNKKYTVFDEIISGLLIAIVMIPETIAYSYMLKAPPNMGFKSSIIMGLITSLFGTPTLISGATGAVATSLFGVVKNHGIEYIPFTVILGGILQLLFGITGLYKLLINVPSSINSGFLIALAVLIGTSQFENLKDEKSKFYDSNKICNILLFSIIGLFIIQYGYIVLRRSNTEIRIPGSILEIVLISLFLYITPIDIPKIKKIDQLDLSKFIMDTSIFENMTIEKILMLLPYAFAMSFAGLFESIVMVKKTNTNNYFNETMVQGVANILSGLTGGMGGCVLVGESLLNINNGSKTRIAAIIVSLLLVLINFFFMDIVNKINISSIIAIMLFITYLTGDWKELMSPKGNTSITMLITAFTGIYTDSLTTGVIVGYIFHYLSSLVG